MLGGAGLVKAGRRAHCPACAHSPCPPYLVSFSDNPAGEFAALFVNPSKTLPVFLGELGPVDNLMTSADAEAAMRRASNLSLPWTAWSLHMRCPPNMLQDLSGGGCGVGMPLRLTDWGRLVQKYINL